jgi:hypothetical protein
MMIIYKNRYDRAGELNQFGFLWLDCHQLSNLMNPGVTTCQTSMPGRCGR